jgi:hypothetical protein
MDPPNLVTGQTLLRLTPAPSAAGIVANPEIAAAVGALAVAHPAKLSGRQLIAAVRNAGHQWGDRRIMRGAEQAVAKGYARESIGPKNARLFEV